MPLTGYQWQGQEVRTHAVLYAIPKLKIEQKKRQKLPRASARNAIITCNHYLERIHPHYF